MMKTVLSTELIFLFNISFQFRGVQKETRDLSRTLNLEDNVCPEEEKEGPAQALDALLYFPQKGF